MVYTSSTSTPTTSRDESGLSPDGTTAHSSIEDHEVEPATEYDIDKILESNVSLHDKLISRDTKYKILTLEVNPDVSCYPRRQVHRSNIETSFTEDYYRITYYNEWGMCCLSEGGEKETSTRPGCRWFQKTPLSRARSHNFGQLPS